LVKGLDQHLNEKKIAQIKALGSNPSEEEIQKVIRQRARIEKIAIKDAKLRTFITQDDSRDDLVSHIYDITYGGIRAEKDNLVVIDDSIVRGTTLRKSIFKILDRLRPKKIVIVSSAPQIRYPDCYGIDMAKLGDFIAFNAAIALLRDRGMDQIIEDVYTKSLSQMDLPKEEVVNYVKEIYSPFKPEEISAKISELLTPKDMKAPVEIVFQSIENLHKACPNNLGDWYFTGNYPTPGGNKVVNKAFINWKENRNERAY
jgi:amidophosphoribosyltransferase